MSTLGAGTTLSYSADGGSYTPIGVVKDCKWPKVTGAKIDTTHYGTPAAANGSPPVKTNRPGLAEPGDVTFVVQYGKTQYAALKALRSVPDIYWKITLNDGGSTLVFQGWVMEIDGEIPNENLVLNTVKIQMSGDDVFTPAA